MVRWGLRGRLKPWSMVLVAAALVMIQTAAQPAAAAETVNVVIDQARLLRLPKNVATLVVGNPLIADATLQSGGVMVLTGKSYGVTNLLALDRNGRVLMQRLLRVRGPHDTVVVYRGVVRETYSCAPICEPRIMLGDANAEFAAILGQTTARNAQSQAAAR